MVFFPIIMFGFGVLKDFFLDPLTLGLQATGAFTFGTTAVFGWGLGFFANILFGIATFFWAFNKQSRIQGKLFRWLATRVPISILAGIIPGAHFIIPEESLLVYFAHRREKKAVAELSAQTQHHS